MSEPKNIRVGIIGCGSLGTAILKGLLRGSSKSIQVTEIHASTTSSKSAQAVKASIHGCHGGSIVKFSNLENDTMSSDPHLHVAQMSDVIILACPPPKMKDILGHTAVMEAADGKILVSVLAGVTTLDMQKAKSGRSAGPYLFRALPNLAVEFGASATAIEIPSLSSGNTAFVKLVDDVFSILGEISHVPADLMDASSVLCGSTPAFMALFMDGLVDGAVAAGVPRTTANAMLRQVLSSSAALLQGDKPPSALRESVCAMPGCTIKGSVALDQGGVRGASANAMRLAIEAASKLG